MSKKFLSGINVTGSATLNTVADAGTNTDKFLVLDSSGVVSYRTALELYNDLGIGALPAGYTSTVKHTVKAGVALTKGQAVYVTGADGTNMIVGKASNASEATSSKTMGLIESSLSVNGQGVVVTEGLLAGLDTTGANNPGDLVWLGTDGNLLFGLSSKPTAPAHMVFIGIVTRVNANNGEIFVKVQNGFEMNELHNYAEGSVQNNEVIVYESSTSLYKPKSISTILGYTPANAATYVPYTGATTDVDLGNYSLNTSNTVNANSVWANLLGGGSLSSAGTLDILGSDIIFATGTAGSTSWNEKMRLKVDGKFGVGTASPSRLFHVSGAGTDGTQMQINGTVDSAGIKFVPTTGNNWEIQANTSNQFFVYNRTNSAYVLTLASTGAATFSSSVTASSLVKSGGTSAQILMADGSVLTAGTNITISGGTISASGGSGGVTSFNTRTGAVTLSSSDVTTALGFTPYNSTNPSGYITSSALGSYLPLSGGTLTGNLKITPVSEAWAEGISFIMTTSAAWGGLRFRRERSGYDGNWAIGYTGLDNTDDIVFVANNGGTQVNNILRLTKAGVVTVNGGTVITSNNIGSQSVSYASSAGNADTLDGYHGSNYLGKNGNSYYQQDNWIQIGGFYGLYSTTNNAHFLPNNQSYGAWRVIGDRGGWRGLHFGEGTGMTLMMNETEFGFHRQGSGWYARFTPGTGDFSITGNAATATNLSGFDKTNPTFGAVYSTNWFRSYGDSGLYNQDFACHWRRNVQSSYGTWEAFGYNKNGYSGLLQVDPSGYLHNLMYESGNGGMYTQNGNGWQWYYNISHNCISVGGSTTDGSVVFRVNGNARITGNLAQEGGYAGFGGDVQFATGYTQYHGSNTAYNWRDWGGWGGYWWSRNGGDMIMNLYALYAVTGSISDMRYKKDVTSLSYGLNEIMQLNPIKYHYNLPKESMLANDPDFFLGFSAQEVQGLIPEAVHEKIGEDTTPGMLAITYDELIPVLVNGIKEQQLMIHNQNIRIQKLEALVTQLLNN